MLLDDLMDEESYYKLPANFPTLDAYAEYVKDNIRVGMQVNEMHLISCSTSLYYLIWNN